MQLIFIRVDADAYSICTPLFRHRGHTQNKNANKHLYLIKFINLDCVNEGVCSRYRYTPLGYEVPSKDTEWAPAERGSLTRVETSCPVTVYTDSFTGTDAGRENSIRVDGLNGFG